MSAVTFNERWAVEFKKRVQAEQAELKNKLAEGLMPDHAAYKFHAGKHAGLESALELLAQSLEDIQKT